MNNDVLWALYIGIRKKAQIVARAARIRGTDGVDNALQEYVEYVQAGARELWEMCEDIRRIFEGIGHETQNR